MHSTSMPPTASSPQSATAMRHSESSPTSSFSRRPATAFPRSRTSLRSRLSQRISTPEPRSSDSMPSHQAEWTEAHHGDSQVTSPTQLCSMRAGMTTGPSARQQSREPTSRTSRTSGICTSTTQPMIRQHWPQADTTQRQSSERSRQFSIRTETGSMTHLSTTTSLILPSCR